MYIEINLIFVLIEKLEFFYNLLVYISSKFLNIKGISKVYGDIALSLRKPESYKTSCGLIERQIVYSVYIYRGRRSSK